MIALSRQTSEQNLLSRNLYFRKVLRGIHVDIAVVPNRVFTIRASRDIFILLIITKSYSSATKNTQTHDFSVKLTCSCSPGYCNNIDADSPLI